MIHSRGAKSILALLLVCTISFPICPHPAAASDKANDRAAQTEDTGSSAGIEDFTLLSDCKYDDYLAQNKDAARPEDEYAIDAADYTQSSGMQVQTADHYAGMDGVSVLTGESGWIEWTVPIRQSGFYSLSVLYYPVEGKSSNIQRAVYIDGKLPFSEASIVEFTRQWGGKSQTFQKDNQGDELRPEQIEMPEWSEAFVRDSNGYYGSPLQFYLSAGTHTIRFLSHKEPMILRKIRVCQNTELPTYREVREKYAREGYKNASGQTVTVQAEHPYKTSSPTLYPVSDRSSPAVEPNSSGVTILNSIGGGKWNTAGQWIEWEISVPETGLYKIGMNVKQNWMHGFYVPRKLEIDGEVPFREMEEIPFVYASGWRQQYLGENDPYLFYFTKGKHLLRMEVVYGKAASIMRDVQTSITSLNDIYQQIVMLTGEDVDKWRDYQVAQNLPKLAGQIKQEYTRLTGAASQIRALAGNSSDKEALIDTVTQQLKSFSEDVEQIPGKKDSFKTNIGSLGTWLTGVRSMPLQVDSISLIPPESQMPKRHDSFWDDLVFQVKLLVNSFRIDYNAVGDVSTGNDARSLTVWVGTGRDQANTIKSLIDQSFTKQSGIKVNLMLVDMGTLLQATLAGQGPDVAMQVGNDLPINFAMRGAAAELTQFGDFPEVAERFRGSAMVPFTFRDKTYALPETQTFKMLFYRKDILKKLGMSVPTTWDEVKADISVLSKNHMEFGMEPFNTPDTSYGMFLYQYGGSFYTEDGKASALDSLQGVTAFKEWVKYYQQYTLSREFDVQNRLRTGEDPIVIADYTLYNTLQVAAPEIAGLWGFTQVPGTRQEDGSVSHAVPSTGSASIIMESAKNKADAWEFLKWWTSADVQTKYGREMEALQGPSARYPTANIEALKQLPWPVEDYKNLSNAFQSVQGIPQVPGSYYTARDIQNAFSTVVIDQTEDAKAALMDNVRSINDEIASKRKEFHLDS